ncbi:MAG: hypothetical protein QGH45_23610 [Myxococcota bacterium]|jgi:hypothetical protein|nr:hypothetical protein [Myxococcota bacterium]
MSAITRWFLVLTVVTLPATGALAAGKLTRSTTEAGVAAARGVRVAVIPAARRAPAELDMTAVQLLEEADADDLTRGQMAALAREVDRLKVVRAKLESDGSLSDRDAEKLYRSTVKSCQKVMTPGEVRPMVRFVSVNGRSAELVWEQKK